MRKSIRIDMKCKTDIKQITKKTDVIKNNVILSKLILGLIGSRREWAFAFKRVVAAA